MNYNKKTLSIVLIFVFAINFCFSQNFKMDTVIIEGQIITYIEKSVLKTNRNKNKIVFDYIRGNFFFVDNESINCKKNKFENLFQIDRKQNALFYLKYTVGFSHLNSLFFNKQLNALTLNKELYPNNTNYSFKDKKYIYKCTKVKVKCLRVFMSQKELIHFIPYEQYNFNFDKVPVYILQEIIEL